MGAKLYNSRKQGYRDGSYMPPRDIEEMNEAQLRLERQRWAESLDDMTVRSLAYDYQRGVEGEDTLDAFLEFKRRWPHSKYGKNIDRRRLQPEVYRRREGQSPSRSGSAIAHDALDDQASQGEAITDAPKLLPEAVIDIALDAIARHDAS
jgi:hypothetical protein